MHLLYPQELWRLSGQDQSQRLWHSPIVHSCVSRHLAKGSGEGEEILKMWEKTSLKVHCSNEFPLLDLFNLDIQDPVNYNILNVSTIYLLKSDFFSWWRKNFETHHMSFLYAWLCNETYNQNKANGLSPQQKIIPSHCTLKHIMELWNTLNPVILKYMILSEFFSMK